MCFVSSTRSLFLQKRETHQSHAHKRTQRIINQTEHSVHFSCVRNVSFAVVVVVVVVVHETKEEGGTKRTNYEKNQPLNRGNHERDDGKKPKRPTERATRTTNGPGRVREGEDNATLRANRRAFGTLRRYRFRSSRWRKI